MRISFWLRNWKRTAPAARRRTQTSVSQRASFRPRLEALEDRMLPSCGGPHPGYGGGSGGGSGGGLPYATAATTSQLIADINYANKAGGTITINLKSGTTFDLTSMNNTTNGYNGLPVIGGTKAVDLTILGNGDTIERDAGLKISAFRLFDVAQGASLTLDHVTLQNGSAVDGGAIYNQGTLKVTDSSDFSLNNANNGGAIYNAGGTVKVSNGGILSGNSAGLGGGHRQRSRRADDQQQHPFRQLRQLRRRHRQRRRYADDQQQHPVRQLRQWWRGRHRQRRRHRGGQRLHPFRQLRLLGRRSL